MIHLIKEIELSENPRSFTISNIKATGRSLFEVSKNKASIAKYLGSMENLKVRGKSNQLQEYLKLRKSGVRIKFPIRYSREILISEIIGHE